MPKQREDFTTDDEGFDHHPAFGMARIGRITATPGQTLFQSDLQHREYIEVTISEAERKRDLKADWVHSTKMLLKFSLSMAQFASFIASGGTEGVPVTLEWDHGDRPGLLPDSRLALTSTEVHAAAEEAFAKIRTAEAAYEAALNGKAPAAERRKALSSLRSAIANATPNVDFAAKRLAEHAEGVVEKSRADIEAMAAAARDRQARELEQYRRVLELERADASARDDSDTD